MQARKIRLDELEFAVLDVETTGLRPSRDQVIEIAVRRQDATGRTVDSFHSLIRPAAFDRAWSSAIHGIQEEEVENAPTFKQLSERVAELISGAVPVAHNAEFDLGFLRAEMHRSGRKFIARPYLCTMELRKIVGLPGRLRHPLIWACWHEATDISHPHSAWADTEATSGLLTNYLAHAQSKGAETLADLRIDESINTLADCPASWSKSLVTEKTIETNPDLQPRDIPDPHIPQGASANQLEQYQQALVMALIAGERDRRTFESLHEKMIELDLTRDQLAVEHRRFVEMRMRGWAARGPLDSHIERFIELVDLLSIERSFVYKIRADIEGATDPSPALEGKKICFSGNLSITRPDAVELARAAGMEPVSQVTRKVDFLVSVGPSAKTTKAEEYQIPVLDESAFLALVGLINSDADSLRSKLDQ